MILDASAVLAIVFRAPGHEALLSKLARVTRVGIGAPTLAELGIVLCAQTKRDARALLTRFIQQCDAQTVAFGESHGRVALDAYLRYGKGRHAADLTYGECLSYAVARLASEPLLAASPGFAHTDLELA